MYTTQRGPSLAGRGGSTTTAGQCRHINTHGRGVFTAVKIEVHKIYDLRQRLAVQDGVTLKTSLPVTLPLFNTTNKTPDTRPLLPLKNEVAEICDEIQLQVSCLPYVTNLKTFSENLMAQQNCYLTEENKENCKNSDSQLNKAKNIEHTKETSAANTKS